MKEKISIINLEGKELEKGIAELTENGKKELKIIEVSLRGEKYKAVILMDFTLLRKAMGALISTDVSGDKKNPNVSVSVDDLGAGDKLLFQGWYEGDEDIRRKIGLRTKACKQLGQWLQSYMDENSDDEDSISEDEEKKS